MTPTGPVAMSPARFRRHGRRRLQHVEYERHVGRLGHDVARGRTRGRAARPGEVGRGHDEAGRSQLDLELVVGRGRGRVPVHEHDEWERARRGRRVHGHREETVAARVVHLHVERAHRVRAHRLGQVGRRCRPVSATTIPATAETDRALMGSTVRPRRELTPAAANAIPPANTHGRQGGNGDDGPGPPSEGGHRQVARGSSLHVHEVRRRTVNAGTASL